MHGEPIVRGFVFLVVVILGLVMAATAQANQGGKISANADKTGVRAGVWAVVTNAPPGGKAYLSGVRIQSQLADNPVNYGMIQVGKYRSRVGLSTSCGNLDFDGVIVERIAIGTGAFNCRRYPSNLAPPNGFPGLDGEALIMNVKYDSCCGWRAVVNGNVLSGSGGYYHLGVTNGHAITFGEIANGSFTPDMYETWFGSPAFQITTSVLSPQWSTVQTTFNSVTGPSFQDWCFGSQTPPDAFNITYHPAC